MSGDAIVLALAILENSSEYDVGVEVAAAHAELDRLRSRVGEARSSPYWGCTCLSGCPRGFGGTEETMPREWEFCPGCGGPLYEITIGGA